MNQAFSAPTSGLALEGATRLRHFHDIAISAGHEGTKGNERQRLSHFGKSVDIGWLSPADFREVRIPVSVEEVGSC
jgi:hypothetical protein